MLLELPKVELYLRARLSVVRVVRTQLKLRATLLTSGDDSSVIALSCIRSYSQHYTRSCSVKAQYELVSYRELNGLRLARRAAQLGRAGLQRRAERGNPQHSTLLGACEDSWVAAHLRHESRSSCRFGSATCSTSIILRALESSRYREHACSWRGWDC